MSSNLAYMQEAMHKWRTVNFPDADATQQLLGVAEETGELSHAHLKAMQGIRVNEDHEANAKDAVGDIVIYLMGYCSYNGWDLMEIIAKTCDHILQRDWNKNKETGEVPEDPGFFCAFEVSTGAKEYRKRCLKQCLHCRGVERERDVALD